MTETTHFGSQNVPLGDKQGWSTTSSAVSRDVMT